MGLFRKKPKDGDVVDMHARSPNTGLRYKDIALLGQMAKGGADLARLGGDFDGWEASV